MSSCNRTGPRRKAFLALVAGALVALGGSALALADSPKKMQGMSPESYDIKEMRDYRADNEREAAEHFRATQDLMGYQTAAYINQVIAPKINFLMDRNKAQEQEIRYLKLQISDLDHQLAKALGHSAQ